MRGRAWLFAMMAVVLAVVALPAAVGAQQPATLEVTVDRTQVTVGDRIAVTLRAQMPSDAQPDLSGLDRQFGDLDVLVIGLPEERALGDGRKEIRVRYEVAAFRPGPAELPALRIPFTSAEGDGEAVSQPIGVTVLSVLQPGVDPGEVKDLKPQIDLPFSAGMSTRTVVLIAGGAALALLVLAFGGWRWWQSRRVIAEMPVAEPIEETVDAVARAELDRISGLGLLEAGDIKTFHALIAACIRRYLSDRYGFAAFAMTTTELSGRMEQMGVDRWPARLVGGLLGECDAVSYARYEPARIRADNNLVMAYEIVDITREGAAPVPAVR
jgi:hypothetical protein